MRNILRKEMKLSASPLSYLFIIFGLMFFLPGYPVLFGPFFVTMGIFQGFQTAREANDVVFSALLPIRKRDVVKGKFLFVCLIEGFGLLMALIATLLRMTALADSPVYRANALMNANLFALGGALLVFALFNAVFLGIFFKTGYKVGKAFIVYMIAALLLIIVLEALHHVPGLAALNAFGRDRLGLQLALLAGEALVFALVTVISYGKACRDFEKIDL